MFGLHQLLALPLVDKEGTLSCKDEKGGNEECHKATYCPTTIVFQRSKGCT